MIKTIFKFLLANHKSSAAFALASWIAYGTTASVACYTSVVSRNSFCIITGQTVVLIFCFDSGICARKTHASFANGHKSNMVNGQQD